MQPCALGSFTNLPSSPPGISLRMLSTGEQRRGLIMLDPTAANFGGSEAQANRLGPQVSGG